MKQPYQRAFLLLNLDTGGIDGVYFDSDLAETVWRRKFKAGEPWLLLQILHYNQLPPRFPKGIPDHLWWLNREPS
jgi:hypothetical protein